MSASDPGDPDRVRPRREDRERTYGVIGAMAEEVETLVAAIEGASIARVGPFDVHRGRLEGHPVLVAECGIGKVNGASLAQALIGAGADAIVFTGVAGGVDPELAVGDLVVSRDAVQHDVDVTALGYAPGEVPGSGVSWPADPVLVRAAAEAAREAGGVDGRGGRVLVGRVASGDTFVASPERVGVLRATFEAVCVEMEGAAVAQVCHHWGIPFVIVRSISDTADHDAQVDFRAFTRASAARAELVVRGTLRRLG